MSNPYQSPSLEQDLLERPPLSSAEARALLHLPALGLIVAGGFGLIVAILAGTGGILVPPDEQRALISPTIDLAMILGAELFIAMLHVAMLFGGRAMLTLRGYNTARWGAVITIASLGGLCLLGLPFGIWALFLLRDERVRNVFDEAQTRS